MFSLQKFFGKDPVFFDLFDQSARHIIDSVAGLEVFLKDPSAPGAMQKIKDARRASKEVTEELHELVIKTFVTSLEREDIEALSTSLYRVIKPVEKFAERYRIANQFLSENDFLGQVKILRDASEHVKKMVSLIRRADNLDQARRLNSALKQSETDADALEVELLEALYADSSVDAKRMFLVKDMFNLLEKGIDRCRDSGAVVMQIALKCS
jgi:uncharacterized protein Yka (UPF0111/DUF47 family)